MRVKKWSECVYPNTVSDPKLSVDAEYVGYKCPEGIPRSATVDRYSGQPALKLARRGLIPNSFRALIWAISRSHIYLLISMGWICFDLSPNRGRRDCLWRHPTIHAVICLRNAFALFLDLRSWLALVLSCFLPGRRFVVFETVRPYHLKNVNRTQKHARLRDPLPLQIYA